MRKAVLAVTMLVTLPARAQVIDTWQNDNSTGGFRLEDVINPPPACADAVASQFVTPGAGWLKSSGVCPSGVVTANPTIPANAIIGDPGNVAIFDDITGLLTDDNRLKFSNGDGILRIGPAANGFLDRLEVKNTNATNDARVSVWNDGSAGTNTAPCYVLFNDTGHSIGAALCLNSSTTSSAFGGPNTAVLSNPLGGFALEPGGVVGVGNYATTDGAFEWFDGTPAVCGSGGCCIASFSGVLKFSCHGGAWTAFGTGGGTVTAVTGSGGISVASSSPTPNVTLANFTCSTGQFVNAATTGSGLACTTPAYQTWTDDTFTPLPQESFATAGPGLSIADDPADTATIISLPSIGSPGSCTNCNLTFDSFGRETARASGTAPVTSVTASPPLFSSGGTTPNLTEQGAIVSGSTSTTAQNTGALTTGLAKLNVSAGVNTFSTAGSGTDYQPPTTLTCTGSNWAKTITTAGSGTCTQPAFSDVSGSATCAQLPALTGDVTTSAGSCSTTLASIVTSAIVTAPRVTYDVKGRITATSQGYDGATVTLNGSNQLDVTGITDGSSANWSTVGASGFVAGQPLVAVAGGKITTNAISSFGRTSSIQYNFGDLSNATWNCSAIPGGNSGTFCNPDGNNTEFGKGFAANFCRVIAYVSANAFSGPISALSFQVTQNGSSVTGCVTPAIAAGATGVFDSGQQAVTGAASDTWGLHVGSHYTSGTASIWVDVEIYQ